MSRFAPSADAGILRAGVDGARWSSPSSKRLPRRQRGGGWVRLPCTPAKDVLMSRDSGPGPKEGTVAVGLIRMSSISALQCAWEVQPSEHFVHVYALQLERLANIRNARRSRFASEAGREFLCHDSKSVLNGQGHQPGIGWLVVEVVANKVRKLGDNVCHGCGQRSYASNQEVGNRNELTVRGRTVALQLIGDHGDSE